MSDTSHDELHELARLIGKRRIGFQGDHYDVDSVDRERSLALGAEAVGSRELVRRLREAGLRRRGRRPRWSRLASSPPGAGVAGVVAALDRRSDPAAARMDRALAALASVATIAELTLFVRSGPVDSRPAEPGTLAALLDLPVGAEVAGRVVAEARVHVDRVVDGRPRPAGDRSMELFVVETPRGVLR